MIHCIYFVHDVTVAVVVSDQRGHRRPVLSDNIFIGQNQRLFSCFIFLNLSSTDNQAQN